MGNYFVQNDWIRHDDLVFEAANFLSNEECAQVISYIENKDSSCTKHNHLYHTPNSDPDSNTFTWKPECLENGGNNSTKSYDTFAGMYRLVHSMNDAANRYTMQPMRLAKVVTHKYSKGAMQSAHRDVFPLATLMYLNDEYEGGELFFSNTGFSIKPRRGSLLAFNGGDTNSHGVSIVESGYRYVVVAFWEYEDLSSLRAYWDKEHELLDSQNNVLNQVREAQSQIPDSVILYSDTFPILKINNFLSPDYAKKIVNFLQQNHDGVDECFGAICFREYWEKIGDKNLMPTYTEGMDETTLASINESIMSYVSMFLGDTQPIAFSKFKAHAHVIKSYSPPHSHGPSVATAMVSLGDEYGGGMQFIPQYDIKFKLDPYALYIFAETEQVRHGVEEIVDGTRYTLVSHWQDINHPYDKAGANV